MNLNPTRKEVFKFLSHESFEIVDGIVNVFKDVDVSNRDLIEFPFRFGRVGGSFWCHNNQLNSLRGVPKSIGGGFVCLNNPFLMDHFCYIIIKINNIEYKFDGPGNYGSAYKFIKRTYGIRDYEKI